MEPYTHEEKLTHIHENNEQLIQAAATQLIHGLRSREFLTSEGIHTLTEHASVTLKLPASQSRDIVDAIECNLDATMQIDPKDEAINIRLRITTHKSNEVALYTLILQRDDHDPGGTNEAIPLYVSTLITPDLKVRDPYKGFHVGSGIVACVDGIRSALLERAREKITLRTVKIYIADGSNGGDPGWTIAQLKKLGRDTEGIRSEIIYRY